MVGMECPMCYENPRRTPFEHANVIPFALLVNPDQRHTPGLTAITHVTCISTGVLRHNKNFVGHRSRFADDSVRHQREDQ